VSDRKGRRSRTCRSGLAILRTGVAAAALLLAVRDPSASELTVSLKNIAFSSSKLEVRSGDTVTFLNEDPVRHNVYSPTEPDSFDLGAYAKGQSKSVVLQGEGEHEIRCSIHSNMKMTILVTK
jgi:plastocyanin